MTGSRSIQLSLFLGAFLVAAMPAGPLRAQNASTITPDTPPEDWPTIKCTRYRKAYSEVVARLGTKGLGQEFLESHQRFLDSNCTARAEVCPISPEEFKMADTLILLGMNHGMPGTFFPFSCRK